MGYKLPFVVLAAMLALADISHAEDAAGAGANDCSSLVVLYDGGGARMKEDLLLATGQWAIGYMTGLNARAARTERRDLDAFNSVTLGEEVLSLCRMAPEQKILDIVTAMYWDAPMVQSAQV